LRIPTGAVVQDAAGNALAGLPIADNTTITVNAPATFAVQSVTSLGTGFQTAGNLGSGFVVKFNAPVNLNGLNLYNGDGGATLNERDVEVLDDPTGNDSTSADVLSFGSAIQAAGQPGAAGDELRFNAVQTAPDTVVLLLTGPNHVAAASLLAAGTYRIALR